MGKGGGGPSQTTSTSYQTNIPEYARPYTETMLNATQAQLFNSKPGPTTTDILGNTTTGPAEITGFQPYKAYGGTYDAAGNQTSYDPSKAIAGFSPAQQQAQAGIMGLQVPGQFNAATNLTGQAALGSLNAADQATTLQNQALGYGQAGATYGGLGANVGLQGGQQAQGLADVAGMQSAMYGGLGAQQGMQGSQLAQRAAQQTGRQAGMYGAMGAGYGAMGAGLAPQAQAYGQTAADIGMGGLGYGAQGANAAQRAARQSTMYGGLGAQAGQNYAGESAGYGSAGAQYGSAGAQTGQNLGQQLQDTGTLQAYMNPYIQASLQPQLAEMERQYGISGAQQQSGATKAGAFGGSREALMAAENQRNKNTAMNQAIGQGYNTAFQNAQQQLQAANQAALAGTAQGMQGAGMGLQGVGQAGSQAMQGYGMGLQGANQAGQFGLQGSQAGLAGLGTAMQGQQAGLAGLQGASQLYGQGMQGAQAGLQGVGAQQAAGQLGLQGTAQGMQGAQAGLAGVGQQLASGQLGLQGAQTGMQGAGYGLQGAQAGLAGVQGAIGGGQYGLQGLGQAGAMGNQLAGIGNQQLQAQQGIYGLQNQVGQQQQAQQQQIINQAIQDYANAQQYPLMQLGTMSNMLRGLPMQAQTTNQYVAAPNPISQGIGTLGAGASLYNAFNPAPGKAEGGTVRSMASGGITSVPRYDIGGEVYDDLQKMTPEQLEQQIKSSSSPRVKEMAQALLRDRQPVRAASGGIMHFAEGTPKEVDVGRALSFQPWEKSNYRSDLETPERKSTIGNLFSNAVNSAVSGIRGYLDSPHDRLSAYWDSPEGKALRAKESELTNLKSNSIVYPWQAVTPAEREQHAANQARAESGLKQIKGQIDKKISGVLGNDVTPTPTPTPTPTAPQTANVDDPEIKRVMARTARATAADTTGAPRRTDAPRTTRQNANAVKPAPQAAPEPQVAPASTGIAAVPAPQSEYDKLVAAALTKEKDPYLTKTTADIMKEKEDALGIFKGRQEQRAREQAALANVDADSKRTMSLRAAEFFAAWGTTPGPVLTAGLNALKQQIPNLISDKKEEGKLKREINKSIYALDEADRLEKSGNYDAAEKYKFESRKLAQKASETLITAASRVKTSEISSEGTKEAARIQAEASKYGADKRSADARVEAGARREANTIARDAKNESIRDRNFLAARAHLEIVQKDIDAATKNPAYIDRAAKIARLESAKELSPQLKTQLNSLKAEQQKVNNDFQSRLKDARDAVSGFAPSEKNRSKTSENPKQNVIKLD